MREDEAPRMQEQALRALLGELPVEREVAVLVIAEHGMPGMRQVDPNLVRAPGQQPYFQQAELGAPLAHPDLRARGHAPFLYAHAPFAAGGYIFVQRLGKLERPRSRRAFDDRRIDLFHLAFAELAVHLGQGAALLAHDKQARRVPVEPVSELEQLRLRPRGAQRFNDAVADAAPPVDRDAGRLVDDEQRRVLVHDRKLGRPGSFYSRRDAYRRHAHAVADLQPVSRSDTAAIHPYFAAAEHAIDMGF